MRADSLANSLFSNDYTKFWKDISKYNNNKIGKFANVVDGCVGDKNSIERWRTHFEKLYNCNNDSVTRNTFISQLRDSLAFATHSGFTVQHILKNLQKQKSGKSPGLDGICMEALIHASPRLAVHVWLLFNLFVRHGYLPKTFMQSVIVPIIKDKTGNLSDITNYRAIAVSTAFSKLFESVVEASLISSSITDKYQFGFKPGHSTGLCTGVF